MADAAPSQITILKPGTFTDINGTKVTFTRGDLVAMAESYDATSDPAPMVVGHPKTDHPAYGWIGALRMQGDTLVAEPSDVEPAFAEAVRAKRYAKISPSFYPPRGSSNPKPGGWYLKHLGFLGGAAPAIKGLGTVSLAADDADGATTLSFQEHDMSDTQSPEAIAFAAREAELTAEIDQLKTDAVERERAAREAAAATRHEANVAFAEDQFKAGKLAPRGKDRVVVLLDQLDADTPISFGEADGDMTPAAAFRSLFDDAQPIVSFAEAAGADKLGPKSGISVSFAAPPGYTVMQAEGALHAAAKALQAADPKLSFWDAINQARAAA